MGGQLAIHSLIIAGKGDALIDRIAPGEVAHLRLPDYEARGTNVSLRSVKS
jgi:hypothetical protein